MQQVVKTSLEGGSSAAFESARPAAAHRSLVSRRELVRRRWLDSVRVAGSLAACLPALWQLALLVRLYLVRFRYSMDIEWLEGAALYQGYRVMMGQPTYLPSTHGYFPLTHPLGYPTLLGFVGRMIGGLSYVIGWSVSLSCFV